MSTILEILAIVATIWMVAIILVFITMGTISFSIDVYEDLRRIFRK